MIDLQSFKGSFNNLVKNSFDPWLEGNSSMISMMREDLEQLKNQLSKLVNVDLEKIHNLVKESKELTQKNLLELKTTFPKPHSH
jgi:uncharacterized protein (DUF342 family)